MFDPSSGRCYRIVAIGQSHHCSISDRRYSTVTLGENPTRRPWEKAMLQESDRPREILSSLQYHHLREIWGSASLELYRGSFLQVAAQRLQKRFIYCL
ncbi:hypothetical protein C4D60_Mb10t25720 [Musa balbisiana]|uniref:Uncharacterized protein n=1 Tax=Musa balbisiana TaxID=52838 RepID=A0A4S8J0P4_MUSBA|nr:hypothetical protein C4D60_Mb10t25720 [Musa balbisiana]